VILGGNWEAVGAPHPSSGDSGILMRNTGA
jgi:hypothetical protein